MVEQLGLAMMPFLISVSSTAAFTSGTTSGTSRSMRQKDELSITMAPCSAIFGAHSFDTTEPADISTMSVPLKS